VDVFWFCVWLNMPGKSGRIYNSEVCPSVRNSLLVGMAVPLGHIIRISENSLCSHRHELKRVKWSLFSYTMHSNREDKYSIHTK
jgi:hypothetical protein